LRLSSRKGKQIALIENYAQLQGMFRQSVLHRDVYSGTLSLDMTEVAPCMAGPKRPQDRIPLVDAKRNFVDVLKVYLSPAMKTSSNCAMAPLSLQQ
jgi:aconitate hydratase